jgi:hypothetical protein
VRLLFTVTGTFTVQGRGIVLLPELRPVGDEHFRVAYPLRLRRPDGTEDLVPIGGLEFLKPLSGKCQLVVMLLGKEKGYVPIGTEVWSVEDAAAVWCTKTPFDHS